MKVNVRVTETVVYHQTIDVSDDWPGINVVDYDADKHLDLCWEAQRDESAGELERRTIAVLSKVVPVVDPPCPHREWGKVAHSAPEEFECYDCGELIDRPADNFPGADLTVTMTITPEDLDQAAALLERINCVYGHSIDHGSWSPSRLHYEANFLREEAEAGR